MLVVFVISIMSQSLLVVAIWGILSTSGVNQPVWICTSCALPSLLHLIRVQFLGWFYSIWGSSQRKKHLVEMVLFWIGSCRTLRCAMRVMPLRVWGTVQVRGTPYLVAIMAGVDVLQVMLDPRMAGLLKQIDVVSSGSSVQYFSAMPILILWSSLGLPSKHLRVWFRWHKW